MLDRAAYQEQCFLSYSAKIKSECIHIMGKVSTLLEPFNLEHSVMGKKGNNEQESKKKKNPQYLCERKNHITGNH